MRRTEGCKPQHRAVSNAEGPWDRGLALLVDLESHPPALAAIHRHVAGLSLDAVRANPVDGITLADAPDARPWPTALSDAPPGALVLVDASGAAWLLRVTDAARVDASIVAALEGTDIERPQRWRRLDTVVLHQLLLPAWGTTEPQVTYHHDAAHAVAQDPHRWWPGRAAVSRGRGRRLRTCRARCPDAS